MLMSTTQTNATLTSGSTSQRLLVNNPGAAMWSRIYAERSLDWVKSDEIVTLLMDDGSRRRGRVAVAEQGTARFLFA
jgi:hypothetical protein